MAIRTLYDKLWDEHLVGERRDGASLLYIDRHLIHEVTSAQAFAGLREGGRRLWRADASVATCDHIVPTEPGSGTDPDAVVDDIARLQVKTLGDNCREFGVREFAMGHENQGIVHVIGPELGLTLPGMTVVCGDSHTSTHGALGALAFGIGTSDVEHVLATQCLAQRKQGNMRVTLNGRLAPGVSAKDMALAIIAHLGVAGGVGRTLEYAGEAVRALSMEGRMTLCNMAIESGARSGLVAVDEVTLDYIRKRPYAPRGATLELAEAHWRDLHSDADAVFDREVAIDAAAIKPQVSWGTTPGMVVAVDGTVPDPAAEADPARRRGMIEALRYMGLEPGTPIDRIHPDRVFIGSCTNARIEDLREAAAVVRGRKVATGVRQAMVVPGSRRVKAEAEAEGLDRVFMEAGLEWREPGCSMCLAMNPDRLDPQERCASTSNRNFEGRQGRGGRTHLVSPAMAAAAAVVGHFVDVRELLAGAS